jgi:hypothetical protein
MAYARTTLLPLTSTDGTAVTTPASLTDATPLPAKVLPSQMITKDGTLYVSVAGRFTSTATPGTLTVGVYLAKSGVAIASAVLVVASAALVPLASQTNKTWQGLWEIEFLSLGVGGAGVGQCRGTGRIFGVVAAGSVDLVPATAPMTAVNLDTTADQRVLIGLTPSVTTGSVTIHSVDAEYSGT